MVPKLAAALLTKPVAGSTVATDEVELLHTPPLTALLSWADEPPHTVLVPVIGAGDGLTVTGIVAVQPAPVV